ncbi:MAG TPA: FecR family protein [Candidatus Limnocylindria bacterium]|nr:FecR family protein [Candidatus Limnocylindria bacterium]
MSLHLPKSRTARALLMLGTTAVFALVMTGAIAIMFPTQALGSSSTLEVLDGVVAISHDGSVFTLGQDGDMLQEGDVIRTGEGAHAVLTFFDGSIIELEPDSEIRVETLRATSAGDLLMTMQQTIGRSWHVVSRTLTPNSKYEIRTPAATATVRGTAFLLTVLPQGESNIQTTDGVVGMIGGGQEVLVPPGFQSNVLPGGAPEATTPAPAPPAVVRVVLDPTPNAAIVDANKRTVGVVNGIPIRYIPGSTVTLVDGKLVLTIPNPTLGRLDTHVQPASASALSVDVNVQIQVGGAVVGNVVERRTVGANGIAKGGVVLTPTGTVLLPDADARASEDPRIGRVPPPPSGGLSLLTRSTPGPTQVVTPPPSFVSRVAFDPRVTLAPSTPTPAPTTSAVFNGAYQPYATTVEPSATPAPNASLTVFTSSTELTTLRLVATPTPTPSPTLSTKLTTTYLFTPAPALLATPTPTPAPTLHLRTLEPTCCITLATPTPTPAPTALTLQTLAPVCCITLATPTPTPSPIVFQTVAPICCITIVTPTPTPTPTPIVFQTLSPICCIVLPTASPTPTPAPTISPIVFQTVAPICCIALPTASPTPTPAPTISPIVFQTVAPICCIALPTATPTPTPTPTLLRTFFPRCITVVC